MSWDISSLSKKLQEIANKIDSSGEDGCVKDGWIQGKEVSLFTKAVDEEYRQGRLTQIEANSIFRNNSSDSTLDFDIRDKLICRNDAIPEMSLPKAVSPLGLANAPETLVDAYKQDKNYQTVLELINENASHYGKKLTDKEKEYIAKIIIEKCDKYGISELSPVIAQIMAKETGGYVFTKKVMQNPKRSFKGVMQVDLEACCAIMGTSCPKFKDKDGVSRGSKRNNGIYLYENQKRLKYDQERIAEIKKKYKTPKQLYQAIQEDVELGLEVGILAFKIKLNYSKGNVKQAIKGYCGNQYTCNLEEVPNKIDLSMTA